MCVDPLAPKWIQLTLGGSNFGVRYLLQSMPRRLFGNDSRALASAFAVQKLRVARDPNEICLTQTLGG